jgi:hypothetical protein
MLMFEIPYKPTDEGSWYVAGLTSGRKDFETRVDAVAFAMRSAQKLSSSNRATRICIEGADGAWRTFDAALMPIR